MLTCREITELVTDYVEGRMSVWDRVRFQLHVGMCVHCRAFVRQMRLARSASAAVPPPQLTPDLEGALREQFRSWRRAQGIDDRDPQGEK
jgi:predicted anti-sigma-YlaC factor YlaD